MVDDSHLTHFNIRHVAVFTRTGKATRPVVVCAIKSSIIIHAIGDVSSCSRIELLLYIQIRRENQVFIVTRILSI
jgi:hypothetical protein